MHIRIILSSFFTMSTLVYLEVQSTNPVNAHEVQLGFVHWELYHQARWLSRIFQAYPSITTCISCRNIPNNDSH